MEQKKMVKKTNRKGLSVLAAAVLTASLLGGQIYPVAATAEYSTAVTKGSLIPDNVTISEPVELSRVSLPESEYGTLTWADGTFVPSEHVQSCEVIFTPSGKTDVSGISGYDKETGTVIGYVNVVVSSLAEQEEEYEEYPEEEQDTETEEPEITVTPGEEEEPEAEEPEATVTPEEDPEVTKAPEEDPEVTKAPEEEENPEVTETPEEEENPEVTETPEEEPEVTKAPEEEENPEVTETPEEDPEVTKAPEEEENPEVTETPEEEPEVTKAPEEEEDSEITETPEEEDDNIFDRPQEPSEEEPERPSDMEENLTEQEMAEMAEQNHTCNGISVSGINLPWYVQFRATSGEKYDFTNEEDAAIFKSYEFELWDLKNDTEYTIPDGQYISVTVPVKEGYDYSVEHLLDNGAMETIIPNVEDGVMVFSTHSFSPFGIAGSKPIVDNGIAEDGYGGNAEPTKAPETTKAPEATKAPSSDEKNQGDSGNAADNTSVQSQTDKTETNINNNDGKESDEDTDTNTANNTKSVNTGDSTVILPFVILVAAAVIVVGIVLYLKKNRK